MGHLTSLLLLSLSQRMLAHRVGQHYGLQTSTVDYEECNGRVIGVRTKYTQATKVRQALQIT
jgi:hypothetical protein